MKEHENGTIRTVVWSEIFPWVTIVRAFRLAISAKCLVFGARSHADGDRLGADRQPVRRRRDNVPPRGRRRVSGEFPDANGRRPAGPAAARRGGKRARSRRPELRLDRDPPAAGAAAAWSAENAPAVGQPAWRPEASITYPWIKLTEPAPRAGGRADYAGQRGGDSLGRHLGRGGLGTVWGGHLPHGGGKAGGRRAGGLGDGLAVRLAEVAELFCRPAAAGRPACSCPALPVLVLGWLMRLGVFLFLGAFLWPLVLIAAFLMTLVLIGVLFGWPLMWGTISAEGTDSFDALSRSYAYTFQRPLHYLFYAAVAGFIGWLGWLLVREFAAGVVWMSYWAASWAPARCAFDGNARPVAVDRRRRIRRRVDRFFAGCVKLLAAGYLFSYFWAASAAIYFQLRRDVDATATDEVFLDADATEPAPELPAITKDRSRRAGRGRAGSRRGREAGRRRRKANSRGLTALGKPRIDVKPRDFTPFRSICAIVRRTAAAPGAVSPRLFENG